MTTSDENSAQQLPELNDVSRVDDHTWPLKRALRISAVALAIIGIASLAIWGWLRDLPGIWGALIGLAIGGSFMIITVVVTLLTANSNPATTMAVMLGSWLAKIAVVLVIILSIKQMDFYDTTALAVTVLISMVVLLVAETWSVTKAQNVYV